MNRLTGVLATLPLHMAGRFQGKSCESAGRQSANSTSVAMHQEGQMIKGTWGGNHILMEVTEAGAQIEYDCAHGTISEPLKVDRQGKFRAKGTHFRERGGPQRADGEDKGEPVFYSGTTDEKTATLTVLSQPLMRS